MGRQYPANSPSGRPAYLNVDVDGNLKVNLPADMLMRLEDGSEVEVTNLPITYPVTGTFFQATQPVSLSGSVAVTGTFFQATQPVSIAGTVNVELGTATLSNGAETAVSSSAVQILASNANRKTANIQNTGSFNIRVGVSGVSATTGLRLVPGGSMTLTKPNIPTGAIFAIREGSSDSVALAMEAV